MNKAVAILLALLAPHALGQAISLPQWEGMPTVTKTANYLGKCGSAVVSVLAVSQVVDNFYEMETNGELEISNLTIGQAIVFRKSRGSAKLKQLRSGAEQDLTPRGIASPLSDHNGIACIRTGSAIKAKSGAEMILTWSNCAGSACGGDWSFTIINPETLAVDGAAVKGGSCDANCAAKKLGHAKLPLKL